MEKQASDDLLNSLEIDKNLVLSTAHLSEEDVDMLNDTGHLIDGHESVVVYKLDDFGYMVFVDEPLTSDGCKMSDSFKIIAKFAFTNDFTFIRFDRDGNKYPELFHEFDW